MIRWLRNNICYVMRNDQCRLFVHIFLFSFVKLYIQKMYLNTFKLHHLYMYLYLCVWIHLYNNNKIWYAIFTYTINHCASATPYYMNHCASATPYFNCTTKYQIQSCVCLWTNIPNLITLTRSISSDLLCISSPFYMNHCAGATCIRLSVTVKRK